MRIRKSSVVLLLGSLVISSTGCERTVSDSLVEATQLSHASTNALYLSELPPKTPENIAGFYFELVRSSDSGSAESQLQIGMLSHRIALEQGVEPEAVAEWHLQAAELIRKALDSGETGLPHRAIAPLFMYEARVHASQGKHEDAIRSLDQAVDFGFADFDEVSELPEFGEFVELESFTQRVQDWSVKADEIYAEEAAKILERSKSFPFGFQGKSIGGQELVRLEDLNGIVVLVDLWGTWCNPCLREVPHLIRLQNEFGDDGLQIVGVNFEQGRDVDLDRLQEFIESMGINYPCVLGNKEIKSQVPDFRGFPTLIALDRRGKVRATLVGLQDYHLLKGLLSALLQEEE